MLIREPKSACMWPSMSMFAHLKVKRYLRQASVSASWSVNHSSNLSTSDVKIFCNKSHSEAKQMLKLWCSIGMISCRTAIYLGFLGSYYADFLSNKYLDVQIFQLVDILSGKYFDPWHPARKFLPPESILFPCSPTLQAAPVKHCLLASKCRHGHMYLHNSELNSILLEYAPNVDLVQFWNNFFHLENTLIENL